MPCGLQRRAAFASSATRSTRRPPTSSSRSSTRSTLGATRVTVVSGGGGDRLDHHLAELVLLAAARFAPLHIDARIGSARAIAIHADEAVDLTGEAGAMLTLIALGGPATGVTTAGLRWPLRGETLHPGSTRGVSNEIGSGPVRVEISGGSLLAVGSRPLERVDQDS